MEDLPSEISQQAILAALSANWTEALKLNQQLIDLNPKDVDATNRLARAYFELGDYSKSKKHYETALGLDPYNQIASKFIKRIETFTKKKGRKVAHEHSAADSHFHPFQIDCDLFIEEPGKTKVVTLLKVAEPQKLSLLAPGSVVLLMAKNRGIAVTGLSGEYLGVLPDDIAHHLARLIKGGNKYQAFIKTVKINSLVILVREVFRSSRFRNQPSFLDGLNVNLAYSSDNIVVPRDPEEEEPLSETGDEDSEETI